MKVEKCENSTECLSNGKNFSEAGAYRCSGRTGDKARKAWESS